MIFFTLLLGSLLLLGIIELNANNDPEIHISHMQIIASVSPDLPFSIWTFEQFRAQKRELVLSIFHEL